MGRQQPIRAARPTDAGALAGLCGELGYPSAASDVAARLPALLSSPDHLLLVATDGDDRAVAWLHAVVRRQLESAPFVQVAGLVVAEACRQAGLGSDLLARAEAWAERAGVRLVRVRCNVTRQRAHGFYRRAGYTLAKTSHLFTKVVGPARGGA